MTDVGSVHRLNGPSLHTTAGTHSALHLAANEVGDGAIAAEAAVMTAQMDGQAQNAVYRPGVDDGQITEVRYRRRGQNHRIGGARIWPPPTPGQAARLSVLNGQVAQARREHREITGRDIHFASPSGNITPQQAIRMQENTVRIYRDSIRRHYDRTGDRPRLDPFPGTGVGTRTLPRNLRTASRRIDSMSRQPGNSRISGRFTESQLNQLAQRFVGSGYTSQSYSNGTTIYRSADGLREVRLPRFKNSYHPRSGQPRSSTGYVANFQTYTQPPGSGRPSSYSNVHVDVIPTN